MKKHGFTLAEVLIAIGIVGVVAALVGPALIAKFPDRNKVKVLNIHTAISRATMELLTNDQVYYKEIVKITSSVDPDQIGAPDLDDNGQYKYTCDGSLECVAAPLIEGYTTFTGADKYPKCLIKKMNLSGDKYYTDGSTIEVSAEGSSGEGSLPTSYKIEIDVNKNGPDCFAGDDGCKNPDKFRFSVNKWGKVEPVDALAIQYIKNPTNLNSRKDKQAAGLK